MRCIKEPLVITVIESLLLQSPFSIPVYLGDKRKLRRAFLDGGNQVGPVLGVGSSPAWLPQVRSKIELEEKHRHVAANAIARAGDA